MMCRMQDPTLTYDFSSLLVAALEDYAIGTLTHDGKDLVFVHDEVAASGWRNLELSQTIAIYSGALFRSL